jgi:RNA polymerase sigma-70 factor (ECF subfamily)
LGSEITENVTLELKNDSDFGLVKLASNGDRAAFGELFEKHVSRMYAFCLRISSDKDLADELTQTVFIKAWEKMNTFKYESKFSTWLHSIAMNEFLTHKRSGKTFAEKISELFRHKEGHKYNSRFDAYIDIESAISKLPEQARMVVVLHDIEGYKHHEISVMLGIAVGTSKAALHRARKRLRKELVK